MQRVMDPVVFYSKIKDSLESSWASYFGIDNIRPGSTLYPAEVLKFKALLAEAKSGQSKLILARSGAQYLYERDRGFTKVAGVFPRALIFYQSRSLPGQDEAINTWADPNFPADQILLVEGLGEQETAGSEIMAAKAAQILEYRNEKVAIIAEAKKEGWLLLLDSYYPGWAAQVDGKAAPILRADGFFRAVHLPAGKHKVIFSYHPPAFYRSLRISGACLVVCLLLLAVSFRKPGKRK